MNSSLGSPCYSDSRDADIKLISCHTSGYLEEYNFYSLPECPHDLYGTYINTCLIDYDEYGFAHICTWSDGPDYACDNCGYGYFSREVVYGYDELDNNVIFEDVVQLNSTYGGPYTCEIMEYSFGRNVCAENQYLLKDDTYACVSCPSTGVSNGASEYGTTLITDCYAKEGSQFKDATGSGVFTGDCYYTD